MWSNLNQLLNYGKHFISRVGKTQNINDLKFIKKFRNYEKRYRKFA